MKLPEIYSIKDKKFSLMITEENIIKRIKELANQINNDYINNKPTFVIVLKGAMFFATELLKNLEIQCEIETLISKSYGLEMKSSGKVDLVIESIDLEGKDIIIVEDIIDTGLTIKKLTTVLNSFNPKSVKIASLLMKPTCLKVEIKPDYVGFEIEDKFVIGYGLDYAQLGRNLPAIYQVKES